MTQVHELLSAKGSEVWTIRPTETVLAAADKMNECKIGALVVVTDDEQVLGIFTERDLLRRVVGQRRDPATTVISEVMTENILCCAPETSTDEARYQMRTRRIRHLPVADDQGQLVGLISIGDLNAELQASQEQSLFFLQEYISGRT